MLNLNFACLKLLRLLEDGDIESNPGPRSFDIAKIVQGSSGSCKIWGNCWYSMCVVADGICEVFDGHGKQFVQYRL